MNGTIKVAFLGFDSYVLQENNNEVIEHHSRLKLYRTPNTAVNNA